MRCTGGVGWGVKGGGGKRRGERRAYPQVVLIVSSVPCIDQVLEGQEEPRNERDEDSEEEPDSPGTAAPRHASLAYLDGANALRNLLLSLVRGGIKFRRFDVLGEGGVDEKQE